MTTIGKLKVQRSDKRLILANLLESQYNLSKVIDRLTAELEDINAQIAAEETVKEIRSLTKIELTDI